MESYTINALAELTGYDRKVIRRVIADTKPTGKKGKLDTFRLKDFIEALIKARSPDSLDLATERALLARSQREKCDVQRKALEGELVPAEHVRDMLNNVGFAIRRVITTSPLPHRLQDQCLSELRALKDDPAFSDPTDDEDAE